jgi:hypothetical protein
VDAVLAADCCDGNRGERTVTQTHPVALAVAIVATVVTGVSMLYAVAAAVIGSVSMMQFGGAGIIGGLCLFAYAEYRRLS